MKVLCASCNKRMKKLRTCRKCGLPLCYSCALDDWYCRECVPSLKADRLLYEYRKDKYKAVMPV